METSIHVLILVQLGLHSNKPVIIVEASAHAREWIAAASVIYTIDQVIAFNKFILLRLLLNTSFYDDSIAISLSTIVTV